LAQQLAAQSGRIAERLAAKDSCGALAEANALRADVTGAINAHRVPSALLEPLSSAANDLVARIGTCVPPPPQDEHGQKSKNKHGHDKHEEKASCRPRRIAPTRPSARSVRTTPPREATTIVCRAGFLATVTPRKAAAVAGSESTAETATSKRRVRFI
jgi:hypothetical protein